MMQKTKGTNEKMIMARSTAKGFDYKTPEQLSSGVSQHVRAKKEKDVELRKQLREEVIFEKPTASEQVIDAIVTRRLYERELAAHVPEDKELTLKPAIEKTLRQKIVT